MRKLRLLLRSKMKKKFPLFICGDAHQVQDYFPEEAPLPSSEGKDETVQS